MDLSDAHPRPMRPARPRSFNVYVSQPEVKPGCVLRRANFNVLERRGLVDGQQVSACKRNMNTFAFVGDLEKSPEVSCVYHSEEAENQVGGWGRVGRQGSGGGLGEVAGGGGGGGGQERGWQRGACGQLAPRHSTHPHTHFQ